jgi:hypothetical protein
MRTRWLTAAALATACAAAAPAIAQDAVKPASQQKVTVTGCVERADQVLSRDTLGTTLDSQSFVLIKAHEGPAATSTSGPRPTQPDEDAGKTYRLAADADTMNPHVGHRVEIVGLMAKPATNAPVGTAGRDASSGAPPAPLVTVESVKMLSTTCGR